MGKKLSVTEWDWTPKLTLWTLAGVQDVEWFDEHVLRCDLWQEEVSSSEKLPWDSDGYELEVQWVTTSSLPVPAVTMPANHAILSRWWFTQRTYKSQSTSSEGHMLCICWCGERNKIKNNVEIDNAWDTRLWLVSRWSRSPCSHPSATHPNEATHRNKDRQWNFDATQEIHEVEVEEGVGTEGRGLFPETAEITW